MNPSCHSHYVQMVLMGLSPNECLSAAMNGIAFWTKQMSDTCSSYEMYAHSVHAQATATTSHYKMANNQLVEENASLKHQLQRNEHRTYFLLSNAFRK